MPAKRCIETKNMCLLFVDYCKKCLSYPKESWKMGTGEKKWLRYPRESLEMGTGEKKCLSYPKESWRMGIGKKKKQK